MNKQHVSRVPEVTLLFWVIKILSTTVGETGADYLSFRSGLGWGITNTSVIMSLLLAVSLFVQFKLKRYVPTCYWSVVVLMSIVGTLITDLLVDHHGVSLVLLSIVFTVTMAVVFVVWYRSEKTLSIHSINTAKREMFYWIIILLAFALGTGIGDLISERLKLGYGLALLIFSIAIAVIVFGYYVLKLNSVLSFWIAFILTRPVGASLGDFMIKSARKGGLGWGMAIVNSIFFLVIVAAIVYLSLAQRQGNRLGQTTPETL